MFDWMLGGVFVVGIDGMCGQLFQVGAYCCCSARDRGAAHSRDAVLALPSTARGMLSRLLSVRTNDRRLSVCFER